MSIQPIQGINTMIGTTADKVTQRAETPFSAFFDVAMGSLNDVNTLTKSADQMSVDFALGRTDNIADVMVAQEKASTSLQYTVTLGNKLIEAYNEIIRIQV